MCSRNRLMSCVDAHCHALIACWILLSEWIYQAETMIPESQSVFFNYILLQSCGRRLQCFRNLSFPDEQVLTNWKTLLFKHSGFLWFSPILSPLSVAVVLTLLSLASIQNLSFQIVSSYFLWWTMTTKSFSAHNFKFLTFCATTDTVF